VSVMCCVRVGVCVHVYVCVCVREGEQFSYSTVCHNVVLCSWNPGRASGFMGL